MLGGMVQRQVIVDRSGRLYFARRDDIVVVSYGQVSRAIAKTCVRAELERCETSKKLPVISSRASTPKLPEDTALVAGLPSLRILHVLECQLEQIIESV